MGGYSSPLLVAGFTPTPLDLGRFSKQWARAELTIRAPKDARAVGKIPTHDFTAREAFRAMGVRPPTPTQAVLAAKLGRNFLTGLINLVYAMDVMRTLN